MKGEGGNWILMSSATLLGAAKTFSSSSVVKMLNKHLHVAGHSGSENSSAQLCIFERGSVDGWSV